MKFEKYITPDSLHAAMQILKDDENSFILGGSTFLRLSNKKYSTAVDLSNLNLDFIKETESEIQIGTYATLRDVETNKIFQNHFGDYFSKALQNIVGVQFRNTATIGGSVFGRLGFSETITLLSVLNCKLDLYENDSLTITDFIKRRDIRKDILKQIIIKKDSGQYSYKTMQNSAEDIPVVSVAASNREKILFSIGNRPMIASIPQKAVEKANSGSLRKVDIEEIANIAANETKFGKDYKASAEYRKSIARVLVKKALEEVVS